MEFKDYETKAKKTFILDNKGENEKRLYLSLGLMGETGEVAELIKKWVRDDNYEEFSEERRDLFKKELGDVLWYLTLLSDSIGSSLEEIAKLNNEKLSSRLDRGKLGGSGDNR